MLAQESAKKTEAKVLKSYDLLKNVLSYHRVAKVLKISSHSFQFLSLKCKTLEISSQVLITDCLDLEY